MAPQFYRHEQSPIRTLVHACTGARRVDRVRGPLHDGLMKRASARGATAPKRFSSAEYAHAYPLRAATCGALSRRCAQKYAAIGAAHHRQKSPQATASSINDFFVAPTAARRHHHAGHCRCARETTSSPRVFNSKLHTRTSAPLTIMMIDRAARSTQRVRLREGDVHRTDFTTRNSLSPRGSENCVAAKATRDHIVVVIMRCFKMTRKFAEGLHDGRHAVRLLDDNAALRRNGTALRFECVRAVQRCANRNSARSCLDEASIATLRATTMIVSSRPQPVRSDSVR